MEHLQTRIAALDWASATQQLHQTGYACLPHVLLPTECDQLRAQYDAPDTFRKTVTMARYRFGLGEYKYYTYPLPPCIETMRHTVYSHLFPVANAWMHALQIPMQYPPELPDFLAICHEHQQQKPTALILKYGPGGFNTLHQDLYGEVYFPLQMVIFLDQIGADYEGGEFVLVQQNPRAQSKAIVLRPNQGDMLIFTTNFRPEKGSKGYHRVHVKHAVSEVRNGNRHTLGIIFHDAAQ